MVDLVLDLEKHSVSVTALGEELIDYDRVATGRIQTNAIHLDILNSGSDWRRGVEEIAQAGHLEEAAGGLR